MEAERERILEMVAAGTISAVEANELLAALESEPEPDDAPPTDLPVTRDWEIPFAAGLVISFFGVAGLLRRSRGLFGGLAAWTILLLGATVTAIGLGSRNSPWLHIRVRSEDGDNVNVSLPIPFFLASPLLELARRYAGEELAAYLDGAGDFLQEMQEGKVREPFSVQIDDGDGDQVLVYLG